MKKCASISECRPEYECKKHPMARGMTSPTICFPRAAASNADALTIITTCKNLGIDPRCYMRDTLRRILDGEKSLDALLPENYKARATAGPSDAADEKQAA
jgi:hypothetical protein